MAQFEPDRFYARHLLLFHDKEHRAGVLTRWETRSDGLYAYGRLSGSGQDKERVRAYVVEAENFESIHNHSAYALIEKDKESE